MNAANGYNARRVHDRPVQGNARWVAADKGNRSRRWPEEDVAELREELASLGVVGETTEEIGR